MPGRVGSCLMLLLPVDSSGKRERKEPLLKKKITFKAPAHPAEVVTMIKSVTWKKVPLDWRGVMAFH